MFFHVHLSRLLKVANSLTFQTVLVVCFTLIAGSVHAQDASVDAIKDPIAELFASAEIPLRVLVVPKKEATLSSRLSGTILTIEPDDGESFVQGQELVRFDCAANDAELTRAEAVRDAAQDTFDVKQKLVALGSVSGLEAILAQADVKRTAAEVLVVSERVRHCTIAAPYDGRVVKRLANAFETVAQGIALIEILSDTDVELRVNVPSEWIQYIAIGDPFQFELDELDGVYQAEISAIGARIENVSQTIELRAKFPDKPRSLLAGMSGKAMFGGVR